jgi:metallophosphoesterase superfamily enzyme
MTQNYLLLNKTIFFPKQGILAIGDLHIGYNYSLIQSGILLPEQQVQEIISDLKKIFSEIKDKRNTKSIFL